MLLAGGGVRGGHVIGESGDKAMGPKGRVFTPDDVAASFFHNLGIDHTRNTAAAGQSRSSAMAM